MLYLLAEMLTREELGVVLRPFREARRLPRAAFVDEDVLELEERTIFARSAR